jgi:glycosyltransferase involved in cell wall biosynthesis
VQHAALHVATSLRLAKDFDIIHNHNGPPSDLGMAASHLVDTPMLTTLHNQPASDTEFIWRTYCGWYNCISEQQARALGDVLPEATYGGVVYNGIDVDSFPFREEKSDYVLFMGRMSPEKAPHLAIEAALRAGHRIVLAGKVSAPVEKAYFDARVRPLLGNSGVEYVGEADADSKRILFAGARALLVPLLWEEPFGLVVVEAMACGTPVVAFNRGATPELVVDGKTGFLVPNVDEMAAALENVDRILPADCRSHVTANFSPGALADGYLKLYESILSGKEPPLDRVTV